MGMKHRIRINIATENGKNSVLEGADKRFPARLLRWLFGGYSTVYLLKPGETIDSVEVHEVREDDEDEAV